MPPRHVLDSSNAVLDWRTQIVPLISGIPAMIPPTSPWAGVITEVRFFTHAANCPVEVRRFAIGCEASIGFEDGTRFEPRVRFTDDDGGPAAVGFAHDADAVRLATAPAPDLPAVVARRPELLRALRAALFRHRVRTAPGLDGLVNVFGRDWLAQAFLRAAAGCAASGGDVRDATEEAADASSSCAGGCPRRTLPSDAGRAGRERDGCRRCRRCRAPPSGRRHQKLLDALAEPAVPCGPPGRRDDALGGPWCGLGQLARRAAQGNRRGRRGGRHRGGSART